MKPSAPRVLGLGVAAWTVLAAAFIAAVQGYRTLEWSYSRPIISSTEDEYPAAVRYLERVEAELAASDASRPAWAGRYYEWNRYLIVSPHAGYVSWYSTDIGDGGFEYGRVRERGGRLHLYNSWSHPELILVHRGGDLALVRADKPDEVFVRDDGKPHPMRPAWPDLRSFHGP